MGTQLVQIYEAVSEHTGLKGRMRLAVKTGISKVRAAEIADEADTVEKFRTAAVEILGRPLD